MSVTRLFHAAMMLFWVCCLAALSLACTYAPRGGLELAGLSLFAGNDMIVEFAAAMTAIGLSVEIQVLIFALVSALNLAGAGLVLFSMMFFVFGQEREQVEARPLIEGATICVAAIAALIIVLSIAGNNPGPLMAMELSAMAGLLLTLRTIAVVPLAPDPGKDEPVREDLDELIARQAASHAIFSAQLATLSRRETKS